MSQKSNPIGLLIRKNGNGKEVITQFFEGQRDVFLLYALADTVTGIWVRGGELEGASLVLELVRRAEVQNKGLDVLMWSVTEEREKAIREMAERWQSVWALRTKITVTTTTLEEFQKKWDAET